MEAQIIKESQYRLPQMDPFRITIQRNRHNFHIDNLSKGSIGGDEGRDSHDELKQVKDGLPCSDKMDFADIIMEHADLPGIFLPIFGREKLLCVGFATCDGKMGETR